MSVLLAPRQIMNWVRFVKRLLCTKCSRDTSETRSTIDSPRKLPRMGMAHIQWRMSAYEGGSIGDVCLRLFVPDLRSRVHVYLVVASACLEHRYTVQCMLASLAIRLRVYLSVLPGEANRSASVNHWRTLELEDCSGVDLQPAPS